MQGLCTRKLSGAILVCLGAFAFAGGLAPVAQAEHGLPHFTGSFFSQQVAFSFEKPIGMAIAPDGRMFFTDDRGIVKTAPPGLDQKAVALFDLSEHVNEVQDRGLVGIAVDKGYGITNRSIYLAYTFEDRSPAELAANPSLKDLPKTQRLVRVEVPLMLPPPGEPIKLKPQDEQVILGSYSSSATRPGAPFSQDQACPQPANLVSGDWSVANQSDCIPSDSHEHTIDTVRVDPSDGTLWVSVGDGGSGGSSSDPLAWRSQREESYSGKLLHVDTTGNGLPGHPFCPAESDLTKTCTKVYAKGFRNPFRFFLRPQPDGRPVVSDAGWETREELDLVQPGKNYGWPCREGSIETPTWSERPECAALPASTFSAPLYDYPQITDGAVIGGITYNGKTGSDGSLEYPAEYKGAIFFSDYGNERVWYLRLDEAGTGVAPGYPKVFADELMAVDWATAPNGELMYVDLGFGASGAAQVRQISFDPNNAAPIAVATADKTFGPTPLTVQFDASQSSDPDGDDLDYEWDFNEDGITDNENVAPQKTFSGEDKVTVTLRVSDGDNLSDTDRIDIFPGDENAPVPAFTSGPTTYRDGSHLVFEGTGSDADEGGALDATALSWSVRLDHAGTHVHPGIKVDGDDSVEFTTDTAHDAPSTYIVALTATDEHGLSVTTTRVIQPVTSTVRIEGVPSGGPITYAGLDQTTPFEKKSTVGLIATLAAGPSFTQAGSLFSFDRWLDGGPRIRDLVVPDHDVTLTALYQGPPSTSPLPSGPPPSPPRDRVGPLLSFNPKGGLVKGRKASLRGTARDPSGVRKVGVALRALRKEAGKCRWWSAARGDFAKRAASCRKIAYMPAQLKGTGAEVRWVLPLGGPLPAGKYILYFRTVDKAGNVGFGPGGKRSLRLRVAGGSGRRSAASRLAHQRANR
jgi:glucose/arabinose dehydrogenase